MAYPIESTALKQPTLQTAITEFDPVIERLNKLAYRITACGDQILGPRPSEVEGGEKDAVQNNILWSIQARRERLVRIADQLESEMNRIEGGLGPAANAIR